MFFYNLGRTVACCFGAQRDKTLNKSVSWHVSVNVNVASFQSSLVKPPVKPNQV